MYTNNQENARDILRTLRIAVPEENILLEYDESNECDEVSFWLSSRSDEMQDNLLNIEKGDRLTIENDYEKKVIFLSDGYEVGYAPEKYANMIYKATEYSSKVSEMKESESGQISIKVSFKYKKMQQISSREEFNPVSTDAGNQNWRCPECDYSNRGTFSICSNCGCPRPDNFELAQQPIQKPITYDLHEIALSENHNDGDWYCPKCDFKNKSANKTCPNCGTVKPVENSEPVKTKKGILGFLKKS